MILLTSYPQTVIIAPFQFSLLNNKESYCLLSYTRSFHSQVLGVQRFIHCNIKSSFESHCFLGYSPSSYKSSKFSLFLTVWAMLKGTYCKWPMQDDTPTSHDSASIFLPQAIFPVAKPLKMVCNMSFLGLSQSFNKKKWTTLITETL